MADMKTAGSRKIGDMRKNYLDLAGQSFATAQTPLDYRISIGFLEAFEFTLEPGSESKKDLLRNKEKITMEKEESIRNWKQWQEKLGHWEQYDVQIEKDKIEAAAIGEQINSCWDISKRYGLFND